MTTGKSIAFTGRNFVGKVMSLLCNMLSRLVITFLPRSKRLFTSWLQSPCAVILELPQTMLFMGNIDRFSFPGLPNHWRWWLQPWNEKTLAPWMKTYGKTRQHIKKHRHYLPTNVHIVKAMIFAVVIYGCESWTIRRLSTEELILWTVIL